MSKIKCQMSNAKCQKSIRLNFCRSVPPELLQSFFKYDWPFLAQSNGPFVMCSLCSFNSGSLPCHSFENKLASSKLR